MEDLNGFLIVNKPAGITSFDVIEKLRKITHVRRIGHGGTLDPFATGVLVIAIGKKSTTRLSEFLGGDKTYRAVLKLGEISDTYDRDGVITPVYSGEAVELDMIKKVVQYFVGEIEQIPPKYSAIKIKGKHAYSYARQGLELKLEPRKVRIYSLDVLRYEWPELEIRVKCGKGTYIRSLAYDIGQKLETGAYLKELEREQASEFVLSQAIKLDDLRSREDVEINLIKS